MNILASQKFWRFVFGFALLIILGLAGAFLAGQVGDGAPKATPAPISDSDSD